MTIHDLKCQDPSFRDVRDGRKTVEIRMGNFHVGDLLLLRLWYPKSESFGGPVVLRLVRHVLTLGDLTRFYPELDVPLKADAIVTAPSQPWMLLQALSIVPVVPEQCRSTVWRPRLHEDEAHAAAISAGTPPRMRPVDPPNPFAYGAGRTP